jgi:ElaB/YqjD/DUF883 family membrane-anchored ribosome-binding protein
MALRNHKLMATSQSPVVEYSAGAAASRFYAADGPELSLQRKALVGRFFGCSRGTTSARRWPLVLVTHVHLFSNQELTVMKTILKETDTNAASRAQEERNCRDEEEIARRIEKGINDAKAAVSEKLEDGKIAAERLIKQGRYAVEDGLSELVHNVKRHPISFLGIAFAAGAVFGLLLAQTPKKSDGTAE